MAPPGLGPLPGAWPERLGSFPAPRAFGEEHAAPWPGLRGHGHAACMPAHPTPGRAAPLGQGRGCKGVLGSLRALDQGEGADCGCPRGQGTCSFPSAGVALWARGGGEGFALHQLRWMGVRKQHARETLLPAPGNGSAPRGRADLRPERSLASPPLGTERPTGSSSTSAYTWGWRERHAALPGPARASCSHRPGLPAQGPSARSGPALAPVLAKPDPGLPCPVLRGAACTAQLPSPVELPRLQETRAGQDAHSSPTCPAAGRAVPSPFPGGTGASSHCRAFP